MKRMRRQTTTDERTPWIPVGAIILSVVGIYFVLSLTAGNRVDEPEPHAPSVVSDTAPVDSPTDSTAAEETASSIDGATLYQQACAACHGAHWKALSGSATRWPHRPL